MRTIASANETLVICGPTGSGKTDIALRLAATRAVEIVSADSRQIYRELTVGTAKPEVSELAAVPHHFINELSLGETFSAGQFGSAAADRIVDIIDRGAIPIVVGGSTLYVHALVHGLSEIPPVAVSVRTRIIERLASEGPEALYDELTTVDPVGASTMDHTKTQRLIRALEVFHGTGEPMSSFHAVRPPSSLRFRVVVLTRDRNALYERINSRVDRMLARGLVDEVRSILDAGHSADLNSLRTIGYQEPIRYLRGEIDHDEMVRLIKRNSRRYAKRQLTWFLRRPNSRVLDLGEQSPEAVVAALSEAL